MIRAIVGLDDIKSFRNKLVIFTGAVWVLSIILNREIAVITGCWTLILLYYFKKRQESQNDKDLP